jgi:hypothetical protein
MSRRLGRRHFLAGVDIQKVFRLTAVVVVVVTVAAMAFCLTSIGGCAKRGDTSSETSEAVSAIPQAISLPKPDDIQTSAPANPASLSARNGEEFEAQKRAEKTGFAFIQTTQDRFLTLSSPIPDPSDGGRVAVRIAVVDETPWLLPIYVVKRIEWPRGPKESDTVTVELYDLLNHRQLSKPVEAAMDVRYKDTWKKVDPIENHITVVLRILQGHRQYRLAVCPQTREMKKGELKCTFLLDKDSATQLAKARREDVGLTFEETYRGRFATTDLLATLHVSSSAATTIQNILSTDTENQRATLLVNVGGKAHQREFLGQLFGRVVTVQVMKRQGRR